MNNKNIWKNALVQALCVGVYIALVATFMTNAQLLFGPTQKTLGTVLFLLVFVISAGMLGVLVFGRTILWYLDGRKKEAVSLVFATLGFLVAIAVLILIILILAS